MLQLSLFESSEIVLADDARGRIVLTPAFVPASLATRWFDELRRTIEWKAERRWMYDREVDVPRLTAHFDLDGASEGSLPEAVLEAARRVTACLGAPFNSVGLNLYRD